MKKAVFLSHSLITVILREQCTDVANLFDNSLTPTTEQIEDLHEITRAWLSSGPERATAPASAPKPEAIDPTPVERPEPDEDPFRHYINAAEITHRFTLPVMDLSGVNSSEKSNSSDVTLEDVKSALAEHGAESFAEFCKIPLWSAKGNLGKVIDRGVAGPKTIAWVESLRASEKVNTKKSEKLTEAPKEVSERILWARAREICRVKTASTKAEERLLLQFVNSGATDIDWWLKQTFAFDSYGVLIP